MAKFTDGTAVVVVSRRLKLLGINRMLQSSFLKVNFSVPLTLVFGNQKCDSNA